ncbi:MAG: hypothetical protein H5U02_10060 [Clostridia bacterium]|nr:hypothetical protein [Clostridia bacterium]
MKKNSKPPVKVIGRPDSLTDVLKKRLFQSSGETIEALVSHARQVMFWPNSSSKVEKNVLRCLEKNPAFARNQEGKWILSLDGNPDNDQAHQALRQAGRALTLQELKNKLRSQDQLEERRLVYDGRFVRLNDARWALVQWEIVRQLTGKELQTVYKELRAANQPLSLEELARRVMRMAVDLSSLRKALVDDPRFAWVGGDYWFLKDQLPQWVAKESDEGEVFADVWEAEMIALQEAELMLILNDTDPSRRTYILSSEDLKTGSLRITKRLERLFSGLPPVAWLTFFDGERRINAWYHQEARRIFDLSQWFAERGLEPGRKLRFQRLPESCCYDLVVTDERCTEVYIEAQRLKELDQLRSREKEEKLSLEEIVTAVLRLFPDGLSTEQICRLVGSMRPVDVSALLSTLDSFPFFEETADGNWRFNESMRLTYDSMEQKVRAVQAMLAKAKEETAAYAEEARLLLEEKEGLSEEVARLRSHHREEEALYQQRIAELLQQVERLERENTNLRSEFERQAGWQQTAVPEQEKLSQELEQALAEKEALRNRVAQLESRVMQLQGSLNQAVKDAQSEQEFWRKKLDEMQSRYQQVNMENEGLILTIEELRRERAELRRQLNLRLVRWALWLTNLFRLRRRKGRAKSASTPMGGVH